MENNAENNVTEPQQIENENEIIIDTEAADKLKEKLDDLSHYVDEEYLKSDVMEGMETTKKGTPDKNTKNFLKTFNDVPSLLNSILQKIKESDFIIVDINKVFGYKPDYEFVCCKKGGEKILKMSGKNEYSSGLGYELYSVFSKHSSTVLSTVFTSKEAYAIAEKYFQNYLSTTGNNTEKKK